MVVIEKVNTKIARKLRSLREKSGKTQQELADAFGVSVSSIGMYEIGMRVPTDKVKKPVSYTHLTLPTTARRCRSRWSPYH